MKSHILYCDGASRGNPGPASIGFVLYDPSGEPIVELGGFIGHATNNVAEYRALVAGLETARSRDVTDLEIRLDSLLLVRQVTGEYRVKAAHLKPYHRDVTRLLKEFDRVSISHVPREQNRVADALANEALDEAGA